MGELALTFALLALAAGVLALGARRGCWERHLTPVLGLSLLGRLAGAAGLYFVSAWSLPLLRSLQKGRGFWSFATDAIRYHSSAADLVGLWNGTYVAAWVPERADFEMWVAGLNWLLGSTSPLWPTLIGAALAGAAAWPLYAMARRLPGAEGRGLALARTCLVTFWPSAVLWSLVLTKDGPLYFAAFALLACFAAWVPSAPAGEARPRWWWLLPAAAALSFYLFRLRPYLGAAILGCAGLAYALCLLLRSLRPGTLHAWVRLLLLLAVAGAVGVGGLTLQLRSRALLGIELPQGLQMAVTREMYQRALAKEGRAAHPARESQPQKKAGGRAFRPEAPAVREDAAARPRLSLQPEDAEHLRQGKFQRKQKLAALKWIKERLLLYNPRDVLRWMQEAALKDGGELVVVTPIDYQHPGWWKALPGRLAVFFFRPLPWERLPGVGRIIVLAGLETLLFALLIPGMLAGVWRSLRALSPVGLSLALLALGLACVLSMVLVNLGAIVRLRLMAWLPLLLLFDPAPYRWAWSRLAGGRHG